MVFHFLHINLRSINKNFENFKLFLSSSGFILSVFCFSETWLYEITSSNKLYHYMNYQTMQVFIKRERKERGRLLLKIKQSIEYKKWIKLNINSDDVKLITSEPETIF